MCVAIACRLTATISAAISSMVYDRGSRCLVDRIESEPIGLLAPELGDVFVGCGALEGLEPLGEGVGVEEVGEVSLTIIFLCCSIRSQIVRPVVVIWFSTAGCCAAAALESDNTTAAEMSVLIMLASCRGLATRRWR